MFTKKKMIALAAILLAAALTGCGSTGTETEIISKLVTEAPTETETSTEVITEAVETTEETTEESTEAETEPETFAVVEQETDAPENTADIPTNAELLAMINSAFGIMTDNSVEGNIQAAKDWDIIGENDVVDPNACISAEFLISASMRATGFVTGNSTMAEILECALQRGVITDTDLTDDKLAQASDIVEKAKYAWAHQEFNNEIHVELCDGVIDLTNMTDNFLISGDTVILPSEYAEGIEQNTVYILPKDESGQGGAYKAQTITDNGDGSITISGTPAEVFEVYKSITSN